MDIDTENIVKLISPSGIPDLWKDNPDFYSYLAKLGNYSVEQLSKEPDHLNAEKAAILNQTQELAFANYKTFIRTAECSREIFQQFNKTEVRVDCLLSELPELSQRCSELSRAADDIRRRRRANTTALTRHSALLQVLEVPQLMETLVREKMYEEALQLAAYVRHLGKTHPNIPIIANIVKEVEKWWGSLLSRLVLGLGSKVTGLPHCLQLASHLRRMGVLSEQELRLKFLQARDSWFNSLLHDLATNHRSQHLSKVIELSRTHLFNIVTQYRAVFTDDESSAQATRPKFNQTLLLHPWINEKVLQLTKCIEKDLKEANGGEVGSLLGQTVYLGQSLGRVGMDARGATLIWPFPSAIRSTLKLTLAETAKEFSSAMTKFTPQHQLHKETQPQQQNNQGGSAPGGVIQFYPLCILHNGLANGLNQLRFCAPLCLADVTTQLLQQTLTSASNDILQFYRREQGAMSKEERDYLIKMCICFADQYIPYVQRSLHMIYSPNEISSFLGVTPHSLQSQGLTYLSAKSILTPINHLLPSKLETKISSSRSISQLDESQAEDEKTNSEVIEN